MVRLATGYPSRTGEQRVLLNRVQRQAEVANVEAVITADQLRAMQRGVESVQIDDDIALYCVDLAAATRTHGAVQVGASPRGAQGLMLVARALAVMSGRDYVTPEDIKRIAVPVLAHRLSLTAQAWANGTDPSEIILDVTEDVAGPPAVGASPPRSDVP
jgi:MoxR-like ATPase